MKRILISAIALMLMPGLGNAVTFSFQYFDVDTGFDDPIHGEERRQALERAAYIFGSTALGNYQGDVSLAVQSTTDNVLAFANNEIPYDPDGGGFGRPNVVRQKLLSNGAVDLNGDFYDATVQVNFDDVDWQLGLNNPNDGDQYDFYAVMFHEFTHTLGFQSTINLETGANLAGDGLAGSGRPGDWSVFDAFITDGDGRYLIDRDSFENTQSDRFNELATNEYGWDPSGLYFYGENAVEATGGYLVPLFTPEEVAQGSSVSHLDEDNPNYSNALMSPYFQTGTEVRYFTDVELGMLQDIGYTEISNIDISIVPLPGTFPLILGGVGLLAGFARRRKI